MTTIKDIAKMAGVSTATVSRVINNHSDVSEDTKKKIIKIITENNYRPNTIARSLSTNKSNTIGIFFTDHFNTGLHHPFFREVIYGLEKSFGKSGYDILYFTNRKWGDSFSYIEKCKDRHVDGVVLMGVPRTDSNLDKLLLSDIPSVFVDIDIIGRNSSYVISDNVKGAEKAVNYLYSLGHRKIGMIMGLNTTKTSKDRFMGYQSSLNSLGISYNPAWVCNGKYTEEGGYEAMKQLLNVEEQPTAIFCQSDSMAIGAIRAIEDAGLSVPDNYSIIGFDDIEASRYIKPALTTIAQDKIEMGNAVAKLLLSMIDKSSDGHTPMILPVELVKRDSCRSVR